MGNLKHEIVELFDLIEKYKLNKEDIAKYIYQKEYDEATEKAKSAIIQRFRNKYAGNSKIDENEILAVKSYIKQYASGLTQEITEITKRDERKAKIEAINKMLEEKDLDKAMDALEKI